MARNKGQRQQQSIMPELPQEIIEDILSRLPAHSLLRFRCVCKSWQSLITSQQFIKMHLNHEKSNNQYWQTFIISSSFSVDFLHYDGACNSGEVEWVKFPPKYMKKKENSFRLVGSCNGLICIVLNNDTILVSIREYMKIPFSPPVKCSERDIFGFGYDFSIDDYKVVRMCNCKAKRNFVQIYTFKTNSWRKISQDIPYNLLSPYYLFRSIQFEGFGRMALYSSESSYKSC